MTAGLFDTPENAAMHGFPRAHGRPVASRVEGDDAFVLLDTGPRGQPYPYGVCCSRHDGRWRDGGNANGPGWFQSGSDPHLGTLVCWGLAPEGSDRVHVEFAGRSVEEPVTDIACLAVWWRVPDPQHGWPTVIAFRIQGQWTLAVVGDLT